MQIFGVDFSGASDGGKYIWIAEGTMQDGTLVIQSCERAADHWGSRLEPCLASLVEGVAAQGSSAFGFDFPFGLPRLLLDGASWSEFVLTFGTRHSTPESFREECWRAAGGHELRRLTDLETKTPFCVYNLRIYRQTFYGVRDVLAPLITKQLACVLPMQEAVDGKPWVLEICPASTLKHEGLGFQYKGRGQSHGLARARILETFERAGRVAVQAEIRSRLLLDSGGDALDSVIAAIGVAQTLEKPELLRCDRDHVYAIEGRVLL